MIHFSKTPGLFFSVVLVVNLIFAAKVATQRGCGMPCETIFDCLNRQCIQFACVDNVCECDPWEDGAFCEDGKIETRFDVCTNGECRGVIPPATPLWIKHPELGFFITSREIDAEIFSECVTAGNCSVEHVDSKSQRHGCTFPGIENIPIPFGDTSAYYPINCINYYGAEQVCSWVGGEICSESMWNSACGWSGKNNTLYKYPYGDVYHEDNCLVGEYGDERSLARIGSYPKCVGGLPRLFDMGGSLSEWLSDGSGTYRKFKPISFAFNGPRSKPPCSSMCAGNQMDFKTTSLGVRCCKIFDGIKGNATTNAH